MAGQWNTLEYGPFDVQSLLLAPLHCNILTAACHTHGNVGIDQVGPAEMLIEAMESSQLLPCLGLAAWRNQTCIIVELRPTE